MITRFENGFITKSKLNELVDGINAFVSLTGSILFMATPIVPNGWLKADGSAVSRATYSRLFTAIGTTYGSGDGSTTFNLPDLRGQFIRGFDDGAGVDSGRVLGSTQTDQNKSHTHTNSVTTDGGHVHRQYICTDLKYLQYCLYLLYKVKREE
jgi:microcystin-dependent protein